MATRTILSNDRKQRFIIDKINTHLAIIIEPKKQQSNEQFKTFWKYLND